MSCRGCRFGRGIGAGRCATGSSRLGALLERLRAAGIGVGVVSADQRRAGLLARTELARLTDVVVDVVGHQHPHDSE